MSVNPIQLGESARLDVLRSYGVLDSPPDESVDALVRLASQICGTPIALVSLLDAHRQWFFSNVGLEVSQTPRDVAFCHYTIQGFELLEVHDALEDERFSENPLVLRDPKIRFYAGAPLIDPQGASLGTLCVIDRVPRSLTSFQKEALCVLSKAVVQLLQRFKLERESRQQRLRSAELVVAGVGHQINNPLAYVLANVDYSLKTLVGDREDPADLGEVCEALSDALEGAHRIREIVEALQSFGRTKGSFERLDIEPIVRDCAEKVQAFCTIPVSVSIQTCPKIVADPDGFKQVLTNVLVNASQAFLQTEQSKLKARIDVRARLAEDGGVLIEVEDNGRGIGREAHAKIFEPFFTTQPVGSSIGMGLFVAHHLVRASGGSIEVESELGAGSCFMIRFPQAP